MATGPCVLVPRVCEPNVGKIVLYTGRAALALSDCVIGLICKNTLDAQALRDLFVREWPEFKSLYGGTGARYITLGQLDHWLKLRGVQVLAAGGVSH
jgi:hypothetical protein